MTRPSHHNTHCMPLAFVGLGAILFRLHSSRNLNPSCVEHNRRCGTATTYNSNELRSVVALWNNTRDQQVTGVHSLAAPFVRGDAQSSILTNARG
jgi:hypothetical protein